VTGYKEIVFLENISRIGKSTIIKEYLDKLQSGISIEELRKLLADKKSTEELDRAEQIANSYAEHMAGREDIKVITILDKEYPRKLKVMDTKRPLILYAKGDYSIINDESIAVIGTRTPCDWSVKVENNLVNKIIELSERVIVSGLALGCDKIAHEGCVNAGGRTIAVLPSGFDKITPKSNQALSENIVKKGGLLISEYFPTTESAKYTFVERDAVIAALSDATLVVECKPESGTMETVKKAMEYNRRIGAYISQTVSRDTYSGNVYIIEKQKGEEIKDTESLRRFLSIINSEENLSLFDFGL